MFSYVFQFASNIGLFTFKAIKKASGVYEEFAFTIKVSTSSNISVLNADTPTKDFRGAWPAKSKMSISKFPSASENDVYGQST